VKTIFRASILLLILALVVPAVGAQETLQQVFITSDGTLRIQYPAGWVNSFEQGQFLFGSSRAALDADTPGQIPSGEAVAQLLPPNVTAGTFGTDAANVLATLQASIPASGETSQITIGGALTGSTYEYNVGTFEGMIAVVQVAQGQVIVLAFGTPTGGFEAFRPTANAILNSVSYTAAPQVPTLDTVPALSAGNVNQMINLKTLAEIEGTIAAVDISPDNARVAVALEKFNAQSVTHFVQIYDVASGQMLFEEGFRSEVYDLTFSPDGQALAVAGGLNNLVTVWNVATGAQTAPTIAVPSDVIAVYALDYSPDGLELVGAANTGAAHYLVMWSTAAGTEMFRMSGHEDFINDVAFSADGLRLASASDDGTARVWDAGTGAEVLLLADDARPRTDMNAVAFTPDGVTLAVGANLEALFAADGSEQVPATSAIRLYNVETGAMSTATGEMYENAEVLSVAFNGDGSLLISGTRSAIQFWAPATGDHVGTRLTSSAQIPDLRVNASGSLVIVAAEGTPSKVQIWGTLAAPVTG
jgi:WD40 repeat protein